MILTKLRLFLPLLMIALICGGTSSAQTTS
ncbi:MAG: hypothetical protein QOJ51_2415, partial [Acidobacteriaceae bacterium]|nr:hypothetical protein [Acidobacteriaceae bacterium]